MISKSICLLPSEKKHYWAAAGNADLQEAICKISQDSFSKVVDDKNCGLHLPMWQ
jgi:hypothetical protein